MSSETEQHNLVAFLIDLALELGRTPTKNECIQRVPGFTYKVDKSFGSFSTLVQASGLEPAPNSRVKVSNKVFEKPIEKHLASYEPRETIAQGPYDSSAIINDIHWPFHSQRVVDRFYRYIDDEKPKWVILNGDARDRYSHAKFPRSHNVFTPREEDALAERLNREFWDIIKRLSPESQCVQMMGNHDIRPLKRVLEDYPEAEDWIHQALERSFTFEGVKTIFDTREELMLPGDLMVIHGYRGKLGEHRDFALYNVIVGHTHRAGVVYRTIRGRTLWEMNTGYAGDPEAKGLAYTAQRTTGWTPGFGGVDEDGPRVIIV